MNCKIIKFILRRLKGFVDPIVFINIILKGVGNLMSPSGIFNGDFQCWDFQHTQTTHILIFIPFNLQPY